MEGLPNPMRSKKEEAGETSDLTSFHEFSIEQLKMATSGFAVENIVSEQGLLCAEDNYSICYDDDNGDVENFLGFGRNIYPNGEQYQSLIRNHEIDYSFVDLPLQNDECLALLIVKESEQCVGVMDYLNKLKNQNMYLVARQEAVYWISKVNAQFNFGPLCAYLSVNYFDRFLAV